MKAPFRGAVDLCRATKLVFLQRILLERELSDDLGSRDMTNADGAAQAMSTLEAMLRAEVWFFDHVFERIGERQPMEYYGLLPGGRDHLLSFAQFLFFLRALDCTSAERIAAFIDNHNTMIEEELNSGLNKKKPSELRKALFGPTRRRKVVDSIRALNRPVFAIYEYGHLLVEQMSPKTTENLIEDLRMGGLLEEVKDNSINADQRRNLFASTGFLEETYERSLLVQRRLITESFDTAEVAHIRLG